MEEGIRVLEALSNEKSFEMDVLKGKLDIQKRFDFMLDSKKE